MRQRVITGILFALGIAAFIIPSLWYPIFTVAMAVIVAAVAVYELIKALRSGGFKPSCGLIVGGTLTALVIFILTWAFGLTVEASLALYLLIIGSYCLACGILIPVVRSDDESALRNGLISGGIVFYVSFPLYCLCTGMALIGNGWYYMLIGLCASWISDVFAYFSGVTLGKRKIVPHISPKKTWEGCIGGAVGCALAVMIYSVLVIKRVDSLNIKIVPFCAVTFFIGFLISVMSQLGDWFASVIKRRVGIKDYGNIFPGHGGMMDRFDSAFFTLPVGVLLALIAINFF